MTDNVEFRIQDGDETLLHLNEAQPIDFMDARPLHLDADQMKSLGRLLQSSVRPLLEGGQMIGNNTYRIALSPELRTAVRDGVGTFRLLDGELTGTVISKETGRILGHGQLKPAQLAQFANVTMVLWQVAAVVTAQHFLAEINQELKGINRKLDNVQEFLETQAAGRILAHLKALQRGTQLLQLRTLDAEERFALQQDILGLVREAEGQIAQHALPFAPLREALEAAKDFKPQEVQQAVQKYARHINTALFAARAYVTALSVAAHAGWATDRLLIHRDSVEELLNFLTETVDEFEKGIDSLEERGQKRDPRWSVDTGATGLLNAAGGLVGMIGYSVVNIRKGQRERQREEVMNAKRPLIEFQRVALTELRVILGAVQEQSQAVARLGQASLTLLAQIDVDGNVQKTFRVNDAGDETQLSARSA